MKSVFVSFHFDDDPSSLDRRLVKQVESLLRGHELSSVTGEVLGGRQLDHAVMERIEATDALIALMTPRDKIEGGGYTTHQWVKDEFGHAKSKHIPCVAVTHRDVEAGGAYQSHERIVLDPAEPVGAILRLSATLGLWRKEGGNQIKVQILPDDISARVDEGARWFYRLLKQGAPSEWHDTEPIPEPGGLYLYLGGVDTESLIQVRVTSNEFKYESPFQPQCPAVRIKV